MRLIDADALLKGKQDHELISTHLIWNAPTIEIVRCKDCRHYNTMTNGCKRNPSVEPWGDNDFCSYGEKMEVEHE